MSPRFFSYHNLNFSSSKKTRNSEQEFSIKSYIIPMWIERESYYIFLEEIFTACNDKMNTPVYKMMNWPFSCQTSVKCMIVSEELK